ncbi:MAG: DUF983 domain-containing protein [Chitinophagales bacterium]|nr:DUF983 domain-containing protein [Chitinophagales bacterium]MBP9190806.1 DUF983 domain-containing protein [Chitinophagales bacterium]
MSFRNSQLGVALRLKCPRCKTGNLFIEPNSYKLKLLAEMPRYCPKCHLNFNPETGFYFGAMWMSYAVGVLLSIVLICLFIFVFKIEVLWSFIAMAIIHILITPYLFRFSRALWLSFYVNNHRNI